MAGRIGYSPLGPVASDGQIRNQAGTVITPGTDTITKASITEQLNTRKLRHAPSEVDTFVALDGVTTETTYVAADSQQSGDAADLDAAIAARDA